MTYALHIALHSPSKEVIIRNGIRPGEKKMPRSTRQGDLRDTTLFLTYIRLRDTIMSLFPVETMFLSRKYVDNKWERGCL